jgi:integrase
MGVIVRLYKARQKVSGAIPVVADVSYKKFKKKIYLNVDVQDVARWDARRQNIRNPKGIEKLQFEHIESEKMRLQALFIKAKMADASIEVFKNSLKKESAHVQKLSWYLDQIIEQAQHRKRLAMAKTTTTIKGAILLALPDLAADQYTKVHAVEFLNHFTNKGVSSSTINAYARVMVLALKMAVEDGVAANPDIFKNILPKAVQKRRNAYTDAELRLLLKTPAESESEREAQSYLQCVLFCCGCDVTDILKIPKQQLIDGVVNIRRSKTGSPITFTVVPWVKDFLLKSKLYNEVQRKNGDKALVQLRSVKLMRNLKKLAENVGVKDAMMKRGRHTWATIAKQQGVSKDVIAEALGHKSAMITEVYLGVYEIKHIDAANQKVVGHVMAIL